MDIIQQMQSHRSIRKYKSDPIPDEHLNKILESALRASSSGNIQIVSIIITKDPENKKKLWELHSKQDMILEAPVILTFCADWNRMNKWCRENDAEPGFDNFMCFMVSAGDAFISAQNAALAAEYLGLGICFMGTTLWNNKKLADLFHCPKDVLPITTLVVGFPAEEPPLRDRLPLNSILHNEHYKDYSVEDINRTYQKREIEGWARYMSIPNLRERVEQAGVKTLAQIYTDIKYTKDNNIRCSNMLLDSIRERGFMNNK